MHEYGHPHDHDMTGHCASEHHCSHDCGNCSGDPKAELRAVMEYMVKHNRSHCAELEALAKKLNENGEQLAYEQVLRAVSDFEKGNMRLATVLAAMEK